MGFRKNIFIITHNLYDKRFNKLYDYFLDNQWQSYEVLMQQQEEQLNIIARYAFNNVEYYHNLFIDYGINEKHFGFIDLKKLPVLTKDIINNNYDKFIPKNLDQIRHINGSTGGTTGTPMRYRISKEHRLRAGVLLYCGWNIGGYELSDSMVMMGGASIASKSKIKFVNFLNEISRNIKKISSFDMSDLEMEEYLNVINDFKPKFIRGYPSSIFFFAKWIRNNNRKHWNPKAILTTSEKLHPEMRKVISEVFNCCVFDGYGLNDGGVQAFECNNHNGMHITTENAITELKGDNGEYLIEGEGQIIATSLFNYAFPFFRYDTGDRAIISNKRCACGRQTKLIEEMVGRSVDVFKTPAGKYIHGWFFLYIFWKYDNGINKYQVIQKSLDLIQIKLVIGNSFKQELINDIKRVVYERAPEWKLQFEFVNDIEPTKNGKFKFIINECENG